MTTRRRASMTIATALAVWGGALASAPAVRAGIVAYYPLDGTANEVTGNNTDLSLFGNAGFGPGVAAGLGQALTLDGDGDAAVGQNFQKIAGNSMTAVAWVYANDAAGDWDTIVKNWGQTVGGQFHFGLGSTVNDTLQNFLGNGTNATAAAPLPFEQWLHVAFVADAAAGRHRLYINGLQVADVPYAGTLTQGTATGLGIGAKPNDDGSAPSGAANAVGYWSGAIDDVALFDQALTENQIAQIYNAGLAGTPVGALGVPEPGTFALALVVALCFGTRFAAIHLGRRRE